MGTTGRKNEIRAPGEDLLLKVLKKINPFRNIIFFYTLFQEHAKSLLEEIEELLVKNKNITKQREEQHAALEDGTRRNIAMKRNIAEV